MIRLIETLNYRCLQDVRRPLDRFHVLVGPNASGKTTFLDVIGFLGDMVSDGIEKAIGKRTRTPQDLTWRREQHGFELAVEVAFPSGLRAKLANPEFDRVRYEVGIALDCEGEGVGITSECVWLTRDRQREQAQVEFFPAFRPRRRTVLLPKRRPKREQALVVSRAKGGNDNYTAETVKGYNPSYKQSVKRSALGNLPADESSFPVSTWLKAFLTDGVQQFVLNSLLMREASPPGQGKRFRPDGSNLPWVVQALAERTPERVEDWLAHLSTALPDLAEIRTVEREDDKHRYLVLRYKDGLEIPSWLASDGTLRLLALTLPAYLTDFTGVYLIEEPENGVHPRAVETAFQSLSSVYDAQVLLASHSPVVLSMVEAGHVLCFAKTVEGATDIVPGDQHPKLKEWSGDPNLSVLFAGGVLG